MSKDKTLGEALRQQGVSRRGFLKFCAATASMMALPPSMVPVIAAALEKAGADILLLECVPQILAAEITANTEIPVIGIGAGNTCDGQILVLQDLLGITPGVAPRFAKNFMQGSPDIQTAIRTYAEDVRSRKFPAREHSFT